MNEHLNAVMRDALNPFAKEANQQGARIVTLEDELARLEKILLVERVWEKAAKNFAGERK